MDRSLVDPQMVLVNMLQGSDHHGTVYLGSQWNVGAGCFDNMENFSGKGTERIDTLTSIIHGGRTIATKLFGTLGRSSWTYSRLPLGMSSIPELGPICDGPERITEAATASTIPPALSRSIPSGGSGIRRSIPRSRPGL